MTRIDVLRFDRSTVDQPELCVIDLAALQEFLRDEAPGPAAYVLGEEEFAALIAAAHAIDKHLIAIRRPQNVTAKGNKTTRLAQSFRYAQGNAAMLVNYLSHGRLAGGVRKFLVQREKFVPPRPYFFFLGTSSSIWSELIQRVTKRKPEDPALRKLRGVYFGQSREAEYARTRILVAAKAPESMVILIRGETGTGKEIIARAIHDCSRRKGPFVDVNCGAISSLVDDAFFGHERGAFTDALGQREGYFEMANGGTLFLDEIGELSLEAQAMLLRVLEERAFRRVGGKTLIRVDVKIVVATHRNLRAMVARGEFRQDLIYRLGGFWIATPTLRAHPRDLELHVARLWQGTHQQPALPARIMPILRAWEWPGNVRELVTALEELALEVKEGKKITPELVMGILTKESSGSSLNIEPTLRRAADVTPDNLARQVQRYREARPRYVLLEQTLRAIIERIVKLSAPLTVLRSHTVTLARFAERVQRAHGAVADDPLESWRDLCRVRAVVYTQEEKQGLYAELAKYLELADTGHSPPGDFDPSSAGFRPLEYYVRVRPRAIDELARMLDVEVPREVVNLWGRVRLRTILEEVTLAVRDEAVPSGAPLPKWWGTKLVGLAGVLGEVQRSLGQIYSSVRTWAGSYGAYLTEEDARQELAILEKSLACVPDDAGMAARAGKLAMILGEWNRAIAILEPHVDSKHAPVLRDLGVALCKKHEPGSVSYHRGLSLMENACRLAPRDLDAFASYAGALKRAGQIERARAYYEEAVLIDGTDPYAIGGCLETNLMLDPHSDVIAKLTPAMERAILRCRDRIAASVDLPWAFFDLGKYLTLLGETREGLAAYAEGIGRSNAPFMLETTLRSVESLVRLSGVPDFEVARRMLAIGWCARFPSDEARKRLAAATSVRTDVQGPVVMVVEAGEEPNGERAVALRATLTEGLRSFRGTVLTVGDHGWGWRVVEESLKGVGEELRTINYREPGSARWYPTLHAWADVVASGVRSSAVLVLMLGDDHRTAADRRLAVQLEARVAVLPIENEQEEDPAASEGSAGIVVVRDGRALASLLAKKE